MELKELTEDEAAAKLNDRVAFITDVNYNGFTIVIDGVRFEIDEFGYWKDRF